MPFSPISVSSPSERISRSGPSAHASTTACRRASSSARPKVMLALTESATIQGCCANRLVEPPKTTPPHVRFISPVSPASRLLLPDPTRPTTQVNEPRGMARSMPCSSNGWPWASSSSAGSGRPFFLRALASLAWRFFSSFCTLSALLSSTPPKTASGLLDSHAKSPLALTAAGAPGSTTISSASSSASSAFSTRFSPTYASAENAIAIGRICKGCWIVLKSWREAKTFAAERSWPVR